MEVDANKIENLIADIQLAHENIEESVEKTKLLQKDMDEEEEYQEDERNNITNLRSQLDQYIEDLVQGNEEPGMYTF